MRNVSLILIPIWLTMTAVATGQVVVTPLPKKAPAVEKSTTEEAVSDRETVEETAAESPFLRLTRSEEGVVERLQTSTVRYKMPGNEEVFVDLIGAIHVADRRYFKDLQEQFQQYDVVLFELVMADGVPVPDGRPTQSWNPLSLLMQMGLDVLKLAHQTDHIDYRAKNFVHADLTPTEMMTAIEDSGKDLLSVTLEVLGEMFSPPDSLDAAGSGLLGDLDLLELMTATDGTMQVKRMFAEQVAQDAGGETMGETMTAILVTHRNVACMKVLEQQLKAGKKKIGIFYGAAHMPDFHQRLTEAVGFEASRPSWITAWDMR